MIFNDALAKHLEEGERCEADKGYRGSAPRFVKCPGGLEDPDLEVKAMSARVRNRQETVNEGFKNCAMLTTPYRHFLPDHQTVFGAIAVLTQLSFTYNGQEDHLPFPCRQRTDITHVFHKGDTCLSQDPQ